MLKFRSVVIVALTMAVAAISGVTLAQAKIGKKDAKTVAKISKHFSSVPTMMGEFVQFGPNGEQTGGRFFIKRPGKVRFDYTKPSPILVKADGKTVGIHNRKLKTWDFYPLSKTPLKMLLADRFDVKDKSIKSVKTEKDLTTVVLANKSIFGNSKITLMFDPKSFDLRQWTITDNQGKDTTVMIFNVQRNIDLNKRLFHMDQRGILERQRNKNSNN
ncbi:MAG: outer-membrane lipoprotein carrier protein LolA [Rhizobiaceae bacterium]